ncbi:MAG TPA: glycosyltransferase family 39 protein [Myxococcota bacterium]|nr:glycosyltransferase family 39 protein [Myxococcota bacterium]
MRETSRSRVADAGAALLALSVGALVASTLGSVRYAENPDEAYYVAYAGHIAEQGLAGFRQLFADYAAEPARWLYPNPLRLGFILLAMGWSEIFGVGFASLSLLSLACHVGVVAASYLFLRGLVGPRRALAGSALIGFSPLLLGVARRAWVDGPATLAGLFVLWSFCAWLGAPERRGALARFAIALAAGVLIKETTVLLLLPCAAIAAYERMAGRGLPLGRFALATAGALATCAALWWLAAGDAATVAAIGRIILVSPTSNAYAQELGRGPWYRYAIDLLLLSPWPTLLGIAALGPAALRLRERKPGDAVVWLGLALASLVAAYAPFTKNVRYVSLCEVPLRALAAWLVFSLTGADSSRGRLALAAACIALLCLSGWLSFRAIFVDAGLYDPMTAPLLYLRGLSANP